MLYVVGRKSFEVRREKKIITLPCAENNTRQTIYFAVCKKKTHGKVFAVCFHRGTRQSGSLPCARQKAHGKQRGTRHSSNFREWSFTPIDICSQITSNYEQTRWDSPCKHHLHTCICNSLCKKRLIVTGVISLR